VCEHRDPYILDMVGFRRLVAGTDVNHWWDDGANAIAFSRGDKGFVAINRNTTPLTATMMTGLAAGTYCDRLAGGRVAAGCVGASLTVTASGSAQITLSANAAIVVDVTTKM
jgi:alpha-amylase